MSNSLIESAMIVLSTSATGDQPFWGEACRRAGVGPAPMDVDSLTPQRLADGLRVLAQPQARSSVWERVGHGVEG